jgi:hypothetical protein
MVIYPLHGHISVAPPHQVLPQELVTIFDYQELELMLNGMPNINLTDWREHTKIHGAPLGPVLEWFWEVITEFTHEEVRV